VPIRVGMGKDSHAFEEEGGSKKLILGGKIIEGERGMKAHSDGDVISHAVFNALASAVGERSIGNYFPDNDPKWKNADSKIFLEEAKRMVAAKDYSIANIAIVVECKRPKIVPHEIEMKKNLAKMLGIKAEQISITATSGEGLTPFGKGLGIEVTASVMLFHESVRHSLGKK